ncbi:MAG: DUF427 domain-containing protein [Anaerolineae bacterium]|nr:DUF427 domain-containing protein [Anaerolineae bacterium]
MAKAVYNGVILAESDNVEIVEGNVYFPPESVNMDYFNETTLHTTCPWKGEASYYTVIVGDNKLDSAAWYYPEPKQAANNILNHVAFYTHKVQVER